MKKHINFLFFILSIFLFSFLIFKPAVSAEDAGLLQNGVQQFFDNSGNPLSRGEVYFYDVGTTTFKDTYTSSEATTINPNPIILNAGGKAPAGGIYGIGLYRQIVKDRNGNLIWDAVTSPVGGGGSTPTSVGDGNLVGTVLPWSGLIAPNQYVFAYGQEINRADYPEFFTAITLQANVICTASSNTLTGISDTSQIPIGANIELSLCVPNGSTVVSKTVSSITLNNPSNVSINAVARIFPYGNGDGTLTFNVPDLRDLVLAGRPNMGGQDRGLISSTYYGTVPAALGARGGTQNITIASTNSPQLSVTITDPGHFHNLPPVSRSSGVVASGSGSTVGSQVTAGGVTDTVTTGITAVANSGSPNTPISIIQPTLTINYIIKITPDTSTSIATGVFSIGGMTGNIGCGYGILCTGNIISFNGAAGGDINSVQYKNTDGSFGGSNNFKFISPDNLTLGATGVTGKFDILGFTSGYIRQQAPAIAGTTAIMWGNSSGTPAVTASAPLAINTTTGNITCSTCATASLNAAALTRINDTNVTVTLGGSPSTALLNATSLTLGWTGTLSAARGGFGSDISSQSGVPLFATGVPTFTSTTGTGNFVRANSPTFTGTPILNTPSSTSLIINGTGGAGFLNYVPQSSSPSTPASGIAVFANGSGQFAWRDQSTFVRQFGGSLTGSRTYTLPDANITVAALNSEGQTVSGGANVTSKNLGTISSGTMTIDCGARQSQYLTNNGAFTLAAPSSDGFCAVEITNGASAGTVTFSGFSVNSSWTGAPLTTTNGNRFTISIARTNGHSVYTVIPQQ